MDPDSNLDGLGLGVYLPSVSQELTELALSSQLPALELGARRERRCPHHRKQDGLAPKPACPELLPAARLARTREASPPSPPSSSAPRTTVRRGRGSCGLAPTFPVTGRASMGLCRVCPGHWPFRTDPAAPPGPTLSCPLPAPGPTEGGNSQECLSRRIPSLTGR